MIKRRKYLPIVFLQDFTKKPYNDACNYNFNELGIYFWYHFNSFPTRWNYNYIFSDSSYTCPCHFYIPCFYGWPGLIFTFLVLFIILFCIQTRVLLMFEFQIPNKLRQAILVDNYFWKFFSLFLEKSNSLKMP